MASRPLRWLVLFFTRPIRLSDFSAVANRLMPRPKSVPAPTPLPIADTVPMAASAAPIEVPRSRPAQVRQPIAARKDAGPSVSAMLRPDLGIGVSEQPIDTLPAELRDELQRPSPGGLQGSLRNA